LQYDVLPGRDSRYRLGAIRRAAPAACQSERTLNNGPIAIRAYKTPATCVSRGETVAQQSISVLRWTMYLDPLEARPVVASTVQANSTGPVGGVGQVEQTFIPHIADQSCSDYVHSQCKSPARSITATCLP